MIDEVYERAVAIIDTSYSKLHFWYYSSTPGEVIMAILIAVLGVFAVAFLLGATGAIFAKIRDLLTGKRGKSKRG